MRTKKNIERKPVMKDISFSINHDLKKQLQRITVERGIELNALFSYYIMNHDIVNKNMEEERYSMEFPDNGKVSYHLRLDQDVNEKLEKQSSLNNMTKTFYLHVLANAIYNDLVSNKS